MIVELLPILFAYCIGSIPTGWLVAYALGIADITQYGSGNIGATNVGRLLGLPYFVLVLLLDIFKALFSIIMLSTVGCSHELLIFCAASLLIGNGISIFLHGKGGKGIATTLGILLAFKPIILLYPSLVWLLTATITKKMGIACVAGLLALPCVVLITLPSDTGFIVLAFFISLWGTWRHETNIRRYFSWDKAPL